MGDHTLADVLTGMYYDDSSISVEEFLTELSATMTRLVRITALEQPDRVVAIISAIDKYPEDLFKLVEKIIPDIRKQIKENEET